MGSRDSSQLRTRLRQVNVEYSALVRDRSGEGRFVRMSVLRAERRALMDMLFGGGSGVRRPLASRPLRPDVAIMQAAE